MSQPLRAATSRNSHGLSYELLVSAVEATQNRLKLFATHDVPLVDVPPLIVLLRSSGSACVTLW
jgi:hypothetical protein